MKRNFRGVLAAAAAAGALLAAPRAHAAICGDINGNGSRQLTDVSPLLLAALQPANPANASRCGGAGVAQCGDINANGSIGVTDVAPLLASVQGNDTLFALCTGPGNVRPGGTVSTDITQNEVWSLANSPYIIDGLVQVAAGVTLTIQAGVVVQGKNIPTPPDTASVLVFLRDSKINAVGTSTNPIVFTCDLPNGSKTSGCWGGILFNGRAPTNVPGGEGVAEGLPSVSFGGSETNDSSGVAKFCRSEFAGKIVGLDNELNSWTMNSVGAGTTFENIQAHFGKDDGFEWFGGNVNMKNLVSTANADDNFDSQLGYTGALQFGYAAQYVGNIDTAGSNGIESDNNENAFAATPRDDPAQCNLTLVGATGQGYPGVGSTDFTGALFRRGADYQLGNSIITAFKSGMQIRDETSGSNPTPNHYCSAGPALTGTLNVRNTYFFGQGADGNAKNHSSNTGANCNSTDIFTLFTSQATYPSLTSDPGLPINTGAVWPPVVPTPSSASVPTGLCPTLSPYLVNTTYAGAFGPGGLDLSGTWVSYSVN